LSIPAIHEINSELPARIVHIRSEVRALREIAEYQHRTFVPAESRPVQPAAETKLRSSPLKAQKRQVLACPVFCSGAPRPMKMGTASPWIYDAAVGGTPSSANARWPAILSCASWEAVSQVSQGGPVTLEGAPHARP
jgi:hypothetical protein